MTLQSSTIFIDRLRLHAFHGVMEQERRVGADFLVSLSVHYNIDRAMSTDSLEDTLSYADLCSLVRREMAVPSQLLEHVAGRMARSIFECFPEVTAVDLRLAKLNPPMGADCEGAGVEIHLTK
ncbi:MAG: dihydroneopterin aldolase [Prevotella sp.]|nr:dihydroneopterin aldolase [Prevotella sp.]